MKHTIVVRAFVAAALAVTTAACSSTPAATTTSATTAGSSIPAGLSTAATGETTGDPTAENSVFGQWEMTTLQVTVDGTQQEVPYTGQVTFTPSGTMLVQAMNPDAQAADTLYTLGGYEAFYGPVTFDEGSGSLAVKVESAAVRNLIGQTLTRNYEVSGDTLVLTPTDASEGWRVSYERQ